MAELGIFEEEKVKWIQFDEDTEVQMRHIGKEVLTTINQKSEKVVRLSGGNAGEVFNRILGERTVLGWRNIYDHEHPGLVVNKQPLPFSDQNRDMLMKKSIEFSAFVNANCTNSRLFLEEEAESDAKKNA